jgi:hypothetical protein
MLRPDCYNCRYREDAPGYRHSRCRHPNLARLWADPRSEVLSLAGHVPPLDSEPFGLTVSGQPAFVKRGQFGWPYNFDSFALIECSGYTE